MSAKFKVGDKVICTQPTSRDYRFNLKPNFVYTVRETLGARLRLAGVSELLYRDSRFVCVNPAQVILHQLTKEGN